MYIVMSAPTLDSPTECPKCQGLLFELIPSASSEEESESHRYETFCQNCGEKGTFAVEFRVASERSYLFMGGST